MVLRGLRTKWGEVIGAALVRGSSPGGGWVALPSGCGYIGWSTVHIGLGGVWWGG